MADKKIAVIGIGNILLRDDGIGVYIVNELEKENLPDIVTLVDGGTAILDLYHYFIENDSIIVVDTLKGGHEPGTIYRITPEQLGGYLQNHASLHDVQVLDILRGVQLMGRNPEVIIIGIEPFEIFYDMELSPGIQAQIPKLMEIVKNEIAVQSAEAIS